MSEEIVTPIILRLPTKYAVPASASAPQNPPPPPPPPLVWLMRTWTVTDSTLKMWRKARNVRITYAPLPSAVGVTPEGRDGPARLDDLVEYETLDGTGDVRKVRGVDTAVGVAPATTPTALEGKSFHGDDAGIAHDHQARVTAWEWRGCGWLWFVKSRWEILAWGEEDLENPDTSGATASNRDKDNNGARASSGGGERWVVTWFAPTLFTAEGVDFYSDRRSGLSDGVRRRLLAAFDALTLDKSTSGGGGQLGDLVGRELKKVLIAPPWGHG